MDRSIWIGFDSRPVEVQSFAVARQSIRRRLSQPTPIKPVMLKQLREAGLYYRPTEKHGGIMWDCISNFACSTEFAISRFLVPHLAGEGWALFADADVMARRNLGELFAQADPDKACMVVKHQPYMTGIRKMDGQIQSAYERKNWSSVVLWNCNHPAVRFLTPEVVNRERGLWLHQFAWLDDEDIGELDPKWNWLVGHSDPDVDPGLVHFTEGVPTMPGYEHCAYSDEWRGELERWAG
jgi:hypothetical protein